VEQKEVGKNGCSFQDTSKAPKEKGALHRDHQKKKIPCADKEKKKLTTEKAWFQKLKK